jgi:hypothetical protein
MKEEDEAETSSPPAQVAPPAASAPPAAGLADRAPEHAKSL